MAGWLLSVGSGTGILSRLYHGWMVDARGVLPIQRLIWLLGIGSVGVFVMAIDEPITYFLAVIPAFAAGWAWPGLFNLSVIRNNPSAPASATGISQIGIFVGAGFGPVIGGLLVDWGGYRPLWVMCAVLLAIGSVLAMYLRSRIADGGR
jgi:predicted MFS family arabinose efflux permease